MMKTQVINNQNFEAKKFRIIKQPGGAVFGKELNFMPYVEEYSNPNAKQLYNQMSEETNLRKRMKLKKELGYPKIKPLNTIEKIKLFFKKMFE